MSEKYIIYHTIPLSRSPPPHQWELFTIVDADSLVQPVPSLNDCLQTGPPLLTDMCSIILRTHRFAFSTDIEKAFLHVRLHERDQNFTRFLWLSNPNDTESLFSTYRFKVVLFGSASSPFMLNATLHHHLDKYSTAETDDMKNLYVDNLISGCDAEADIINYYEAARSTMMQGKFNLRSCSTQWSSLSRTSGRPASFWVMESGTSRTPFLPSYCVTVFRYQGGTINEHYNIHDVECMSRKEIYTALSRLEYIHLDFKKLRRPYNDEKPKDMYTLNVKRDECWPRTGRSRSLSVKAST